MATRPAEAGETLITTTFPGTSTQGFASESDPATAVCVLPGTELAFDQDVKYDNGWVWTKTINTRVGKFGAINRSDPHRHHDSIEFPNGASVLLTHLKVGQRAKVLQLPAPRRVSDGDPQSAAAEKLISRQSADANLPA